MREQDPKFLIGSKPVNRRTAPREPVPAAPHPQLAARLQHRQRRNQLGAPLAVLVRPPRQGARLTPRSSIAAVLAAGGGVGLFLAWLHANTGVAASSIVVMLAAALLAFREHAAQSAQTALHPMPLLDPRNVAAFDSAIRAVEAELPQELVLRLVELKQQLARIAAAVASIGGTALAMEDQLFLNECVRRYIPDTIQAYLAVPAAARTEAAAASSALQLALEQLGLLGRELDLREHRITQSAHELLLRQQRFLSAKASSSNQSID